VRSLLAWLNLNPNELTGIAQKSVVIPSAGRDLLFLTLSLCLGCVGADFSPPYAVRLVPRANVATGLYPHFFVCHPERREGSAFSYSFSVFGLCRGGLQSALCSAACPEGKCNGRSSDRCFCGSGLQPRHYPRQKTGALALEVTTFQ
jgi:hypothetical protein